jgi:hypothetical protein
MFGIFNKNPTSDLKNKEEDEVYRQIRFEKFKKETEAGILPRICVEIFGTKKKRMRDFEEKYRELTDNEIDETIEHIENKLRILNKEPRFYYKIHKVIEIHPTSIIFGRYNLHHNTQTILENMEDLCDSPNPLSYGSIKVFFHIAANLAPIPALVDPFPISRRSMKITPLLHRRADGRINKVVFHKLKPLGFSYPFGSSIDPKNFSYYMGLLRIFNWIMKDEDFGGIPVIVPEEGIKMETEIELEKQSLIKFTAQIRKVLKNPKVMYPLHFNTTPRERIEFIGAFPLLGDDCKL